MTVVILGLTQTLAWASTYYLPAMLAQPIAHELAITSSTVFAAFSMSLVCSAAFGPLAGRAIDRIGGRPVLMASNLVFATGLFMLGRSASTAQLFMAWAMLGVGMGSGLYEAAFATLVRLKGSDARRAITGVTLFGGFASTVGWPLSAYLVENHGWRVACMAWAGLHLVAGLPMNALLPKCDRRQEDVVRSAQASISPALSPVAVRRASLLLAYVFAIAWFVSTAMAAHLPRLLQASGVAFATAVMLAALVGPAQVAGRVLEFSLLQRIHPLLSARLASLAHPMGAAALLLFGVPGAAVFVLLHGAGNGILTIAIGTLPLLFFGSVGYGQRQGLLMIPARLVQASAPFLFGLGIESWGPGALWMSLGLGLSAGIALWWLPGMPLAVPQGSSSSQPGEKG